MVCPLPSVASLDLPQVVDLSCVESPDQIVVTRVSFSHDQIYLIGRASLFILGVVWWYGTIVCTCM